VFLCQTKRIVDTVMKQKKKYTELAFRQNQNGNKLILGLWWALTLSALMQRANTNLHQLHQGN